MTSVAVAGTAIAARITRDSLGWFYNFAGVGGALLRDRHMSTIRHSADDVNNKKALLAICASVPLADGAANASLRKRDSIKAGLLSPGKFRGHGAAAKTIDQSASRKAGLASR